MLLGQISRMSADAQNPQAAMDAAPMVVSGMMAYVQFWGVPSVQPLPWSVRQISAVHALQYSASLQTDP
jgi:hypothetical protein